MQEKQVHTLKTSYAQPLGVWTANSCCHQTHWISTVSNARSTEKHCMHYYPKQNIRKKLKLLLQALHVHRVS